MAILVNPITLAAGTVIKTKQGSLVVTSIPVLSRREANISWWTCSAIGQDDRGRTVALELEIPYHV